MFLIQILLPLYDNDGRALARDRYDAVFRTLTERYGGVTAFTRAPAEGAWKEPGGGAVNRDRVVVFEVMAERLDHDWWRAYRRQLESDFRQEKVLIRAMAAEEL
jgi:hypothetical protein